MRNRIVRHALLVAVALLVLPLFACRWYGVTVLIPDFDTSQVEGVWFWRLSQDTGQYVRDGQIVFADQAHTLDDGRVLLPYTLLTNDGLLVHDSLATVLDRDSTNPDRVTLNLQYAALDKAGMSPSYRVSSYNAAGDSALSDETVVLY